VDEKTVARADGLAAVGRRRIPKALVREDNRRTFQGQPERGEGFWIS
jgi:hypothetical protein